MFTEHEIHTIVEIPEVHEATHALKKEFCKKEAPYLEISDHDFFSLIMMAPTVGIALADGKLTLFEELALNKKARKLSMGGYFMKKDPVVYAMKFLMKKYDEWSDKFYEVLSLAMHTSFDMTGMEVQEFDESDEVSYEDYKFAILNSPYILIRFISSFFLESDEDIIRKRRNIGKHEYIRLVQIGEKLGLQKLSVYQLFVKSFEKTT